MIRKILINIVIFVLAGLLSGGLGILLYHFYFSDSPMVVDIAVTFFGLIIYSNILSRLYLSFRQENL